MKLLSADQFLARTGASIYLFWGLALLVAEAVSALGFARDWRTLGLVAAAVFVFVWLVLLTFGSRGQGWILRLSLWLWFASLAYLLGINLIDVLANPDLDGSGGFTVSDLWPIIKLLVLSPGYIALQLYGELPVYVNIASFLELQADRTGVVWLQIWTLSLLHYLLLVLIIFCESRTHARFSERLEPVKESPYLLTTRRRSLEEQD